MDRLTLQNPVFAAYVIAATILILKGSANSWLTIIRMMKHNGGFRSPEDLKKTPFNPKPNPNQLDKVDEIERVRRVQLNDLENLPFFIFSAGLFVFTDPSVLVARVLFFGYVALRLLHSAVYLGARTHDARAMMFTPASLILIGMTVRTLLAALSIV